MKDLDLIILCAFRYALGRQTYIVSTVIDFIRTNIKVLNEHQCALMVREIEEAEKEDRLGDPHIDKPLWLDLKKELENVIQRT